MAEQLLVRGEVFSLGLHGLFLFGQFADLGLLALGVDHHGCGGGELPLVGDDPDEHHGDESAEHGDAAAHGAVHDAFLMMVLGDEVAVFHDCGSKVLVHHFMLGRLPVFLSLHGRG